MQYSYFIPYETPSKKNSRITLKNGKTIPSKDFTQWHSLASLSLCTQERPKEPINYPCIITIAFTHKDKHRRDSDNQVSSILDLLQDCFVLEDDKWEIVQEIHVKNKLYAKAYCNIKIEKMTI